MPQKEKEMKSDFIIKNYNQLVLPQILRIIQSIRAQLNKNLINKNIIHKSIARSMPNNLGLFLYNNVSCFKIFFNLLSLMTLELIYFQHDVFAETYLLFEF